jgi:hypothetical protein
VIIISGIAAAMIIVLAISIHLRLSALEPEDHKEGETAEEVLNEILTGQPVHQEEGDENEEGHVEHVESSEAGHEENR